MTYFKDKMLHKMLNKVSVRKNLEIEINVVFI